MGFNYMKGLAKKREEEYQTVNVYVLNYPGRAAETAAYFSMSHS
jgi:hypothetical protein